MFGSKGVYPEMNWFFLIGLFAPVPIWFLSKKFPNRKWIKLINMPIILGATGNMPPARAYKGWWARHNYILSAALDAGVAFTAVLLYFTLQNKDIMGPSWWGLEADDHCPLATCPTAPGVVAKGCPVH
ncbi:oligopeptide transporter 5-like [Pyrus ussuriensis x Pyrus communis]|uniref:Oligopeptide transporter 5-like n=1 Tax=Pyrus ussuriensis x Pyrus communis TaxID=2448454 RepID=A0A5N5G2L7_9ROSA|nr:oligopeptide transporter 5-like [Pyrus ussuriensis x Pyrus communis]